MPSSSNSMTKSTRGAYAAKHVHTLQEELADRIVELEQAARKAEKLPEGVVSISCGIDRRSVPMEEDRAVDHAG